LARSHSRPNGSAPSAAGPRRLNRSKAIDPDLLMGYLLVFVSTSPFVVMLKV
jgi:hypothetical protein